MIFRRLASHPAICVCPEVRCFLTAPGTLAHDATWQARHATLRSPQIPHNSASRRLCHRLARAPGLTAGTRPPPTRQGLLAQTGGSLLDGAARLPKQLLGQEAAVPAPEEAAVPASGGNILRVLKELGHSVAQAAPSKGDGKGPAECDEKFLAEKAKHQARAAAVACGCLRLPWVSRGCQLSKRPCQARRRGARASLTSLTRTSPRATSLPPPRRQVLEKALVQASVKAEQLLHRLGAAADASGAMGLEFGRLAKFEEAEVAVRVRKWVWRVAALVAEGCPDQARARGIGAREAG